MHTDTRNIERLVDASSAFKVAIIDRGRDREKGEDRRRTGDPAILLT